MTRQKSQSRQERLDDGQTYTGFEFKGKHHKPLTGAALKFLQRIKSPIYTSDYKDYAEIDMLLEYLFATSASPKELHEAATTWDEVQYEFADAYSIKDLADPIIATSMVRDLGNQNAAHAEARDDDGGKK